jgi:hypothetical protein
MLEKSAEINNVERKREMLKLYVDDHMTLEVIGQKYGISKERVRQLINIFPEYYKAKKIKAIDIFKCKFCGKTKKMLRSKVKGATFCDKTCFRAYQQKQLELILKKGKKVCSKCKKELKLSEFSKLDERRYYSACKTCRNNQIKEYNERKQNKN